MITVVQAALALALEGYVLATYTITTRAQHQDESGF